MTREQFIAENPPGEGDDVVDCSCGSCDCPGWKIVNQERQLAELEAMERLPAVAAEVARQIGERAAIERERRFWEAFNAEERHGA